MFAIFVLFLNNSRCRYNLFWHFLRTLGFFTIGHLTTLVTLLVVKKYHSQAVSWKTSEASPLSQNQNFLNICQLSPLRQQFEQMLSESDFESDEAILSQIIGRIKIEFFLFHDKKVVFLFLFSNRFKNRACK